VSVVASISLLSGRLSWGVSGHRAALPWTCCLESSIGWERAALGVDCSERKPVVLMALMLSLLIQCAKWRKCYPYHFFFFWQYWGLNFRPHNLLGRYSTTWVFHLF
jgi:hypothetical protein